MSTQAQNETYGARADAPTMSDGDQSMKLHQMRDRLASLSDEARSIRSQVPHEFEPDVERIQQQMQRLGERLSDLSRGALVHYPPAGILSDNRAERPRFMSEEDAKVARAAPDEVIVLGAPADMRRPEPLSPWDEASANALVQLYESGEAFSTTRRRGYEAANVHANPRPAVRPTTTESEEHSCACAPSNSKSAQRESAPGCAVDPSWLDRRFAEIAQRIEQSLAEIRPESSLLTLGKRFDELETQMNSALGQVATRADVDELRIAEAQIEDIGTQLNQLRRQLVRLDTIDAHLGALTAQLSDDRLSRLFSEGALVGADAGRLDAIDSQLRMIALQLSDERLSGLVSRNATPDVNYEGLATAAAQKIAASFVDHKFREAQTRDLGEMRGMLESLIHERRHNDENYASMLETMQQAIIRVLDRIDELEIAQKNAVASRDMRAGSQPTMPAVQEMEADQADFLPVHVDDIAGAPYVHPFAQDGNTAPYAAPPPAPMAAHMAYAPRASALQDTNQPAYSAAPFDLDAAFSRSRDTEAEVYGEVPLTPRSMEVLRHDFIADAHRAKIKAASRPERSANPADMRSGELSVKDLPGAPEKRVRRSIFSFRSQRVAMGVLVLLAAIPAALFFMPRNSSEVSVVPVTQSVQPLSDDTRSGPTRAIKGAAPAAPATEGTKAPIDNAPSKQSQQTGPQAPQGAGEFEDAAQPVKDISYAPVDTASLPDGITMQSNDATAEQIVQHQQQARMAYLSGQLGVAAAKATPAALMEEQVLRMNGAPARTDDLEVGGNASRLPPPTVGPFSLRMAAAQGDASAQFEVASRLAEGKGLDQNLKEAAQWYQRSASNGFAMAQFRLGTLYERGLGVGADQVRAQIWYQRAAEQGNVKAMHNLAVLAAGRITPAPDYKEAARWFAAAAELGLADSQYNLAVLYENGMGVQKDLKQAYKWLLLAANAGDSDAKGRRDALKAKLNVAELANAEVEAGMWRVKAINPVANDAHVAGQAWQEPGRG